MTRQKLNISYNQSAPALWRGPVFSGALALVLFGLGLCFATPVVSQPLTVPSQSEVHAYDQIFELTQTPAQARFRYLMPELKPNFDFSTVADDLLILCTQYALPELGKTHPEIRQIVVSLSDRPVKFGEMDTSAVQVFEVFTVMGDQCAWGDLQ